ncbi:hypothetical protein DES53_105209 [Roseimicrobium gellanilyticum]|uniref:BD-FAE-like domain-containing protein n=2 Tax=Roseimicrobium gellanilyticum TaxID=748857 RepID=A0A366HLK1_9BACT|nr:hypothetical protein DES53_105209 [Roseimicrobium gellanilyticum]
MFPPALLRSARLLGALLLLLALPLRAAPPGRPLPSRPDVSYGPRPLQVLDVYLPPKPNGPSPVLIWYGGIWKPAKNVPDCNPFFKAGCAVIGVQTRTMGEATQDGVFPPISYVMDDACRAVQFVRSKAAEWGLDPERIAVGGGSQGSLPALYVGCAADRANPDATDPVERQSTKVVAIAAFRSQPTIDPKRMQEWVPGVVWGAPALGCKFEESLARRDELLPVIKEWSPDYLLHSGVPPIYFENEWGLTQPEDKSVTETNYKVHAPMWGLGFQKLAQEKGVKCYVKYLGHATEEYVNTWDFLVKQLTAKGA